MKAKEEEIKIPDELIDLIAERAARVSLAPGFWRNDLEDQMFCGKCANTVEQLYPSEEPMDGGWVMEEDNPPQCDRCAADLDFYPTDYCRDMLLGVFADQGVHTDHDAYCLDLCLDGLRYLTLAEWNARFTMQPKDLFGQIIANSRKDAE